MSKRAKQLSLFVNLGSPIAKSASLFHFRVPSTSAISEYGFAKLRTSFANGKMQSKQYEWCNGASGTSGVHDALAYKVVKVTSDVRVEGADMM
ncbi:hypothetical protein [Paenibacillus radicis (ex Gao et al. 2016)]|uniref:Uncharacterized protein n=1 Tax=Paenibacillus radicis (ex Gao et al. 2016) TaxID=1737354 RepID=A0A917HNK6_9BACL|nr:hypothetical protein [Paenibacillus radicis (ex Gao et al. 2016)]GGG85397.1 hypothetical protein GCM10010918_49190 [Paenibacillus radicis (ex Gao et al. 2016)]